LKEGPERLKSVMSTPTLSRAAVAGRLMISAAVEFCANDIPKKMRIAAISESLTKPSLGGSVAAKSTLT
jgi:hypothetical protein